jgi:hypothetical protein
MVRSIGWQLGRPPLRRGVRTGGQIRALDPDVQIVMVTAYGDAGPSDKLP